MLNKLFIQSYNNKTANKCRLFHNFGNAFLASGVQSQKITILGKEFNESKQKNKYYKIISAETALQNNYLTSDLKKVVMLKNRNCLIRFESETNLYRLFKPYFAKELICAAIIPDDAMVTFDNTTSNANNDQLMLFTNRLFLNITDSVAIDQFDLWNNLEFCYKSVCHNPLNFKHVPIKNQTFQLSLNAILSNSNMIVHLKVLYLEQNEYSFDKLTKPQIIELCKHAVNRNPLLINYLPKQYQTFELKKSIGNHVR